MSSRRSNGDGPAAEDNVLKLSPFGLRIFQECRRQYKFRYINRLAKLYEKPRPWFTLGENVHLALKLKSSTY